MKIRILLLFEFICISGKHKDHQFNQLAKNLSSIANMTLYYVSPTIYNHLKYP